MSSPSPPKPQKINPFEGMGTDPLFYEAAQELGYGTVNKASEVAHVNSYLQEKKTTFKADQNDRYWNEALHNAGHVRYYDEDSHWKYARANGSSKKEIEKFNKKMTERHGTEDWYMESERGEYELDSMQFAQIQTDADTLKYEREGRLQQKELDKAYKRSKADSEKAAAEQRAFMEEMMNQPVYMPKQASLPTVQKPVTKQNPILPAPAAPAPMNIAPPPAPELTAANNKMAIVKTPQSTKARQRRSTRGTSSLTN